MSSLTARHDHRDEDTARSAQPAAKDIRQQELAKLPPPPGPRGLSRLIAKLHMFIDPLAAHERIFARYGDVVRLSGSVYLIRSADLVEPLLHGTHVFGKHLSDEGAVMFWGRSIVVSNDVDWLRQRRLMQRGLHHSRIAGYAENMVSYAARMVKTWDDGEAVDLHAQLRKLTLAILTRNVLGTDLSEQEQNDVIAALDATMVVFADAAQFEVAFDTPEKKQFRTTLERLNEIVLHAIARRRADPQDHGDMLWALIAPSDTDAPMSDDELRDAIVTILRAGYRNSATLLAWAFALMARHPEVESNLVRELDEVLKGAPPSLTTLPRLVYAEKVIKETMRLYPLYPVVRRDIDRDCELGGYRIPAGTAFGISAWAMHRDPRYFIDPARFDPNRWSEEFERSLPKFAFLPFSGGPRQCPFKSYGMLEAVLLLATIAQQYEITLAPGERVIADPSLNGLIPKNGLQIIAHRRSKS